MVRITLFLKIRLGKRQEILEFKKKKKKEEAILQWKIYIHDFFLILKFLQHFNRLWTLERYKMKEE